MNTCKMYPSLLERFVLAMQHFEGWCLPGGVLNGVTYPKGSRSFQNNNPTNFKTRDADLNAAGIQPTPYLKSLGAIGADAGHFCIFPSYQTGFSASCQFLTDVLANTIIPYRVRAQALGLPDSGHLSVLQFFQVYAPSTDGNFPAQYAANIAHASGMLVTDPISKLITFGGLPEIAVSFEDPAPAPAPVPSPPAADAKVADNQVPTDNEQVS